MNIVEQLFAALMHMNIEPFLLYSFDLMVMVSIGLLMFFIPRNAERVKEVLTVSYGDEEIEIINDAKDTLTQKMPLTVREVEWYLQEVRKINPKYLKGIKKIHLCDRPSEFHSNIMGSYTPNAPEGKVIRIYSVSYFPLREMFTLDLSEIGTIKFGYDEIQMKKMLLSTLGHEIGHNVFYNKTGRLFGDDVEEFCDNFSEQLGIVDDEQSNGKRFHVDDPVGVYM